MVKIVSTLGMQGLGRTPDLYGFAICQDKPQPLVIRKPPNDETAPGKLLIPEPDATPDKRLHAALAAMSGRKRRRVRKAAVQPGGPVADSVVPAPENAEGPSNPAE